MNRPQYIIIADCPDCLLIQDIGHRTSMSVTNGAEFVVAELADRLNGRRLEYIDSDGHRDQLLVRNGEFAGFACAG